MWKRLHVKCPLMFSDFNETWIFTTDFRKKLKYQLYQNPSNGSRFVPCEQKDGRTDRCFKHVKKVKVTFMQNWICRVSPYHRPHRPLGRVMYSSTLLYTSALKRGWAVSTTPRPPLPPVKTGYPLYRRLGGPQGRSGRVRKISSPPVFDPRTVHTVESWYIDCVRNNWE